MLPPLFPAKRGPPVSGQGRTPVISQATPVDTFSVTRYERVHVHMCSTLVEPFVRRRLPPAKNFIASFLAFLSPCRAATQYGKEKNSRVPLIKSIASRSLIDRDDAIALCIFHVISTRVRASRIRDPPLRDKIHAVRQNVGKTIKTNSGQSSPKKKQEIASRRLSTDQK